MKLRNALRLCSAGIVLFLVCGGCGDGGGEETLCGNGVVDFDPLKDIFEECDKTDLNNRSCLSLGYSGGILACAKTCKYDTAGCVRVCGNGQVEVGEGCDGTNLNGKTCADVGFSVGTLSCKPDCSFDTSACVDLCGNGTIDGGEDCEGTNLNGKTCVDLGYSLGTLLCTDRCRFDTTGCVKLCGNGAIDGGESCDGGNLNGATCLSQGFNGGGTLICKADCTFNTDGCRSLCGNNQLDAGEECDGLNLDNKTCFNLGFLTGTLTCDNTCQFDTSGCSGVNPCGNGQLDTGEDCEGTDLNGQTCEGLGYTTGVLSCSDTCEFVTAACSGDDPCGNGQINYGEACDGTNLDGRTCQDQGFSGGTLACADCEFDVSGCNNCGNGALDAGEDCDGAELDGKTCLDLGFTGGTLSCVDDCTFDTTACEGCLEDSLEENDDQATAKPLTAGLQDLVLCNLAGGEEDWFSVSLQAGDGLAVVARFMSAELDLDLELQDAAGAVLDSSATSDDREALAYSATVAGAVFIRVFPFADTQGSVAYTLDLILNPPCDQHPDCPLGQLCIDYACVDFVCSDQNPCPDDLNCDAGRCVECVTAADCPDPVQFTCVNNVCVSSCPEDSFEPNDDAASAKPVTLDFNQSGLSLCGEFEEDWFQMDLAAGSLYTVDATFTHANGDIDIFLYAATDTSNEVASGASTNDDESLSYLVPQAAGGSHLLRVKLYTSGVFNQTYGLAITNRGVPECVLDADCGAGKLCVDYHCVNATHGDSCDDPVLVDALPFTATNVDINLFSNESQLAFQTNNCTGYGSSGRDVVYRVVLGAGQQLTATLSATFDSALYVVSDCSVQPMPDSVCLQGSDGTGDETVAATAPAAGNYYVVVDHYIGTSAADPHPAFGTFTLNLTSP